MIAALAGCLMSISRGNDLAVKRNALSETIQAQSQSGIVFPGAAKSAEVQLANTKIQVEANAARRESSEKLLAESLKPKTA